MMTTGTGHEARHAARRLTQWNLALLGTGFAWFAYIDASITDGAMWLFAAAVLAGLLSVIAALVSSEQLAAPFGTGWRRAALVLFVLAMALMLAAATATLNLKGTGTDDSDTPTGVLVPA